MAVTPSLSRPGRSVLVTAVAISLGPLFAAGSASASYSPARSTSVSRSAAQGPVIVFDRSVSHADGSHDVDIWTMGRWGGNQHRLTFSRDYEFEPAWSPDGTKIAFTRVAQPSLQQDVWVMNADGSGKRQLTGPAVHGSDADAQYPTWSPDGSRIAYARSGEIWVMNADGTDQHAVTHDTADSDGQPAWSPDGSRIAFVRQRGFATDLWSMAPDGSDPTLLLQAQGDRTLLLSPAWSPDGGRIAYTVQTDRLVLGIMRSDGSRSHELFGDVPNFIAAEPTWSPDGNTLVFSRRFGPLWRSDVAGGHRHVNGQRTGNFVDDDPDFRMP